MPITTFRVFLSSTFEDFHLERAALQSVFERLSAYCETRGAKFQAIDLRWGVSAEAAREQRTLDLCLNEIARCKRLSPRPNFICLLGNRYGWRPVPPRLSPSELAMLAPSSEERAYLDRWYLPDRHALEPEQVLVRGEASEGEWEDACATIRKILTAGLAAAPDAAGLAALVERSATHREIAAGIQSDVAAREHALVYERQIPGLERGGEAAARYGDVEDAGLFFTPAADALAALKSELAEALGPRYHRFEAGLVGAALDPAYLTALAKDVETSLRAVIGQELERRERRSAVSIERATHQLFAEQRGELFLGRTAELEQLERYVLDSAEPASPQLVTGPGGIGKSALIARLGSRLAGSGDVTVITRFIGASAGAARPEALFGGVIGELRARSGATAERIAAETSLELAEPALFVDALAHAAAARRVALLIDGIDQLRFERARDVASWIPSKLPPNLRVIVAGRSGQMMEVLGSRAARGSVITLAPFEPGEAVRCLDTMLAEAGRQVTDAHRERVLARLRAGARPLEVRLIATRLAGLRSFDDPETLGTDLPSAVDALIDELMDPRAHLPALVSRALTLLATGRDGIADDEMASLLALDPEVVDAFVASARHEWDLEQGLPPILWSRLLDALSPYLMLREVDGQPQLAFFHREFEDRVRARLLDDPQAERTAHGVLADYFDGPVEADAFRGVAAGNPRLTRRLNVVAEHLWRSGRRARWAEMMGDFGFLMSRCAARHPESLRHDFALAAETPAVARDHVEFLRETIGLLGGGGPAWPAYKILLQRAMELPAMHGARRSAAAWLEQGACDWVWLLDARAALAPRDRHTTRFAGHVGGVRGMTRAPDGTVITWGADGAVRLCDAASGAELDVFEDHTGPVLGALVDADRILSWSDSRIVERLRSTGERGATLEVPRPDLLALHARPGRDLIALYADGSIQQVDPSSGELGCRLVAGGSAERRGARSFVPGLRAATDGRVPVWSGGQIAVWDVEAGMLTDGWSICYPGFRPDTAATSIVSAGWSDAGDLYAADDCGRLYRRSADGSTLEVCWGANSPHYWDDKPYNGGATVLADDRVLLWQAFLDSADGETRARRSWAIWDLESGALVSEGETQSDSLAAGTVDFMDVYTPTTMHAYPLIAVSETRFIGCHGRSVSVVDLEAGRERIIRKTATVITPPAAVVLDSSTIAFTDDDRTFVARLDGEIAQWGIARGEGRAICGVATAPEHYLVGLDGGGVLGIEIAPGERRAAADVVERDYQLAVTLPGGHFAALEPSPAARGEIDFFDLGNGARLDTLVAHHFELERADPQARHMFETLLKTESGQGMASSFDHTYGMRVVSGLLFTFGFDGIKLWDDRRPEPLLQIDLSRSLGCWKLYPFWLDGAGAHQPALADREPPGSELAIIAQTQAGDTVLVRPMRGGLTVLDRGRIGDPELGHAYHKGLEVFGNRWLMAWYGTKPPRLWDLGALFADASPEPATVFDGVPETSLLDPRMRELVEASPEHHRAITLKTFAEVQQVVELPGDRFAFIRTGGDCLIFARDGARLQAYRGDRLSVLEDETCAAWLIGHPDRGADRRYRVHALADGALRSTSPQHDSDIEGVAHLADGSLLSWTQSDRFWRWSPGKAAFSEVVRATDATAEHGDWLALRAGELRLGIALGPKRWFAWPASNAVGLTEIVGEGDYRTVMWQHEEPVRLHAVDSSGTLLATTASGRLLALKLHRGRERIDFAALAAGTDAEQLALFRGATEGLRATGLRSKALLLCQFDRCDDAEPLLDAAEAMFERSELAIDPRQLLAQTSAWLRLAWSQGDCAGVQEVSEHVLGIDPETTHRELQDDIRLLRVQAAQSYAAVRAVEGAIEEGLEVLIAELTALDPSMSAKPPADRAALLVHLIDSFASNGWLSSARAVLVASRASLAGKHAIVAALNEDPNTALIVQAVHEVVHAAWRARDVEVARGHLDELEARIRAGLDEAGKPEARMKIVRDLADAAQLRARVLADLAEPDEARAAFDTAYTRRRGFLSEVGADTQGVVALMQLLGAWTQFEIESEAIDRARFTATLIARDLLTGARKDAERPREVTEIPGEELLAARDALRTIIELESEPAEDEVESWGFVLETAEFAAARVAMARGFQRDDVYVFLGFNRATAVLKARGDPAQWPAWRRNTLSILVQALDANAERVGPDLVGETTLEIARGYLDVSDKKEANEIAVAVSQRLKQRAVDGDRNAGFAVNALIGGMTEALAERGHLADARATCFSHAVFLREIIDAGHGDALRRDWAETAAKSIALVEQDLGFEQAAQLADHWHRQAVEDLRNHPGKDIVRDWLVILLAQDALYAAHDQSAPSELDAGLQSIARRDAQMMADLGSRAPAGVPSEFERAALAWLGLAVREADSGRIDEALELLERTCAGPLPVERWQAASPLEDVLARLKAYGAALPAAARRSILDRHPAQDVALRELFGWTSV